MTKYPFCYRCQHLDRKEKESRPICRSYKKYIDDYNTATTFGVCKRFKDIKDFKQKP